MKIEDKAIPLTLREQSEEWYDKQQNEEEDMCKEQVEIDRKERERVALLVLWHLERMGNAASAQIPVEYNGKQYTVSMGVEPSKCNDCDQSPWCREDEKNCKDGPYNTTSRHGHASDCATHNMPAYPNGECDCGYPDRTPCSDPACEISITQAKTRCINCRYHIEGDPVRHQDEECRKFKGTPFPQLILSMFGDKWFKCPWWKAKESK